MSGAELDSLAALYRDLSAMRRAYRDRERRLIHVAKDVVGLCEERGVADARVEVLREMVDYLEATPC